MIDLIVGLFHRLFELGSLLYWLLGVLLVLVLIFAVVALIRAVIRFFRNLIEWVFEVARQVANWFVKAAEGIVSWFANAVSATRQVIEEFAENQARTAVGIVANVLAHEYGVRPVEVLFRATSRQANLAAGRRREFLQRSGRDRSSSDIEVPPGLRAPPISFGSSDAEGGEPARAAREAWELGNDNLMLHGRVRDAVMCIAWQMSAALTPDEIPEFHVGLRPLRWWEARAGEHPWIVEIGTAHPEAFRERLMALADWLGVSVGLTTPLKLKLQRGCRASCVEALYGTIASKVTSNEAAFLMTCAHVIPPACCQVRTSGDYLQGAEPDALLLRTNGECTAASGEGNALRPADQSQLAELIRSRGAVIRVGGTSRRNPGRIHYEANSYAIDGCLYRFPACIVRVRRVWYFWVIPWPIVARRFSIGGDSGSVVTVNVSVDGADWIGMVHAGEGSDSAVILASPLMEYLRKRLGIAEEAGLQACTL